MTPRRPLALTTRLVVGGSARGWNAMSDKQTQALLSLIEQDWDLFADAAAHQWLGWSAAEDGRAAADQIRGAVTPRVARAMMQVASAVDVTGQLADVAAPTLVVHRRGMPQIPLDVPRSLAWACRAGSLWCSTASSPPCPGKDPTPW